MAEPPAFPPFQRAFLCGKRTGHFSSRRYRIPCQKRRHGHYQPACTDTPKIPCPGLPSTISCWDRRVVLCLEKIVAARSANPRRRLPEQSANIIVSKTNGLHLSNLMLEECLQAGRRDYETVCQNLLEVLLILMLRAAACPSCRTTAAS